MGISRTADNFYALRMARLMQQDFTKWTAFKLGIIDKDGNVLKQPDDGKEKDAWTKFHVAIRNIKRLAGYIPGAGFAMRYGASYMLLKEIQHAYELTENFVDEVHIAMESVIAGDAGGAPGAIAAGDTSGAITSPGPIGSVVSKRKLRSFSDISKEHTEQAIKVC